MFTQILFKCIACENGPLNLQSFPLCLNCKEAWVECPSLCPKCANPFCPAERCLRPWRLGQEWIDSYSACYLLLSECYRILKKWKTRRGLLFDQQVLESQIIHRRIESLTQKTGAHAVIPVPQNIRRSWQLSGSPADAIAVQLGRQLRVPVMRSLLPAQKARFRQAELSAEQRLKNMIRFELNLKERPARGSTVILVDDFMTTGHTLRRAAYALKLTGVGRIHAFCLGFRPSFSQNAELVSHLVHRT